MTDTDQAVNRRNPSGQGAFVLAALDRVSETYRLPIWLRFCLGFDPAEIAETLDIPERSLPHVIEMGMRALSEILETMNLHLDSSSMRQALAAAPVEPAPGSLVQGLGAILDPSTPPPRWQARWRRSPGRQRRPVPSPVLSLPFGKGLTLGDYRRIHYN